MNRSLRALGRWPLAVLLIALLGVGACATTSGSKPKDTGPTLSDGPPPPPTDQDDLKPRPRSQVSVADVREARAHQSVGIAYLREGRVALAIRELQVAERLNPYDGYIQLGLAEAYRLNGRLKDAELHVVRALDVDPNFQAARLTLSGLYVQMGRYQDAITQARILADDPTFPDPWAALTNLGFAQLELGQLEDARKSLELAIQYEDRYWRAHLDLGILEVKEGKKLDALNEFERVLALKPGPLAAAEANYRIAEIYISLGNRDRAVQHLVAASSSQPSGPWGKRSEEYLKRLR
jgi:tetratricopeptide (TPR) repeat protein